MTTEYLVVKTALPLRVVSSGDNPPSRGTFWDLYWARKATIDAAIDHFTR